MIATKAIAVQKILVRHDFTEQEANDLIDFVENQNGEIATKQDVDLVRQELKHDIDLVRKDIDLVREEVKHDIALVRKDVDLVREEVKHDIDLFRQEVKQEVVTLKKDIKWLKWTMIIAGSVLLAGMTALLSIMLYLHDDTRANIRDMDKKLDWIIQKIK